MQMANNLNDFSDCRSKTLRLQPVNHCLANGELILYPSRIEKGEGKEKSAFKVVERRRRALQSSPSGDRVAQICCKRPFLLPLHVCTYSKVARWPFYGKSTRTLHIFHSCQTALLMASDDNFTNFYELFHYWKWSLNRDTIN